MGWGTFWSKQTSSRVLEILLMSLSIQNTYKISSKMSVFCSGEMVNKGHVSSQLVVSLYIFPRCLIVVVVQRWFT